TALAGLVDIGYIKATGHSVKMYLPKTTSLPEVEFEWKVPKWSNAIERDRARTYFQVYAACAALHFMEKALAELHAGHTQGNRYHARGAQLRSLSAVWCAYVSGQRKSAGDASFPNVWPSAIRRVGTQTHQS